MSPKNILATGVAVLLSASSAFAQRTTPPNTTPGHPMEPAHSAGSTHSTSGPSAGGAGHTSGGKVGSGTTTRGQNAGGHANAAGGNVPGHVQSGGGAGTSHRGTTSRASNGAIAGHTTAAPVGFGPSPNGAFSAGSAAPGGITPADFAKILAILHAIGGNGSSTPSAAPGTAGAGQARGPMLGDKDGDDLANSTAHTIAPAINVNGAGIGAGYRGTTQRSGATTRGTNGGTSNVAPAGATTVPSILPNISNPSAPSLTTGVPTGLIIENLYNGQAKAAGLQQGDIILKIDGMRTQTFEELRAALVAAKDQVTVEYIDAASGKTDTKTVGVSDSKIGVAVSETPVAK